MWWYACNTETNNEINRVKFIGKKKETKNNDKTHDLLKIKFYSQSPVLCVAVAFAPEIELQDSTIAIQL